MATTNVSIRMDADLKRRADELFAQMGLTMSSAVSVFVHQCLSRGKIPFTIEADPFYSEANQAELRRRLRSIEDGTAVFVHKTMDELRAME